MFRPVPNAYRSFRVSDCTYQPFEGSRRFCLENRQFQQTARDQREPERRRWSRDVKSRSIDRSTVGRRLDNDDDDEGDDAGFDNSRAIDRLCFSSAGVSGW